MNIYELLQQSEHRCTRARHISGRLGLMERWSRFGVPYLLGASSMNLVWNRDIDMNIYAPAPEIKQGFEVMGEVASIDGVMSIEFYNFINTPDQGYYWKIVYMDDDGEKWKIDNWFVADDHPDSMVGENLSARINSIITDNQRADIIKLKSLTEGQTGIRGVDIYRAVMEGNISDYDCFMKWMEEHKSEGMLFWTP